jgi:hypothetical protein
MMRRMTAVASALAVLGVLAIAVTPAPAKSKGTKVKCEVKLQESIPPGLLAPNPAAMTGNDFGLATCQPPFGAGVYVDNFISTPVTTTTGRVRGHYKALFNDGTLHGVYTATYAVVAASALYNGTITVAGGTGAFKHAKGKGKIKCASPDVGIHATCSVTLSITRL